MACSRWEESGLLYVADELETPEIKEYEQHVAGCQECRSEVEAYRWEKKHLFTAELLGENPSPEVSQEILRVCSSAKKVVTPFAFIPLFFKKTPVVFTMLLLAGIAGGMYIQFNFDQAEIARARTLSPSSANADAANPAVAPEQSPVLASSSDSSQTGGADSGSAFSATRGTLEGQGVIPVDLKK